MHELLAQGLDGETVDVLIAGDTHVERLELRDGVLFINPGSPTLPHHKEVRLGTAAAATKIMRGLERRKRRIGFPWLFYQGARMVAALPLGLGDWVMGRSFRQATRRQGD